MGSHLSSSWGFELAIFGSLILEVDKFSFKAQTIETLTNLQAPNSSSKCKMAISKVTYQGGIAIWQRSIHDKPKTAWMPIGLGATKQELELWTIPKLPHGGSLEFWLRACQIWLRVIIPHCIHQGSISNFKLSSWELLCKVDLSEQACVRGTPSMRSLFFLSS